LLGSALWASWALPLYTPCVLRGALRFFFNEISTYLSKKKGMTTKTKPFLFVFFFFYIIIIYTFCYSFLRLFCKKIFKITL
jgi:hypothetical protein